MADHFDEPGTSSPMESIEELKEEIMEKHDEYLEQVSDDPELADEEKKKISHLFKRRCELMIKHVVFTRTDKTMYKDSDKLFVMIEKIQMKMKEIRGKLTELGFDVDEEIEVDEDLGFKKVFIQVAPFEPLNSKLSDFVNDLNNNDKDGLIFTDSQLQKMLRDLRREFGDQKMIRMGIPLNNANELMIFRLELMKKVKGEVSFARKTKPFYSTYNVKLNEDDSKVFDAFPEDMKMEVISKLNEKVTESEDSEYLESEDEGNDDRRLDQEGAAEEIEEELPVLELPEERMDEVVDLDREMEFVSTVLAIDKAEDFDSQHAVKESVTGNHEAEATTDTKEDSAHDALDEDVIVCDEICDIAAIEVRESTPVEDEDEMVLREVDAIVEGFPEKGFGTAAVNMEDLKAEVDVITLDSDAEDEVKVNTSSRKRARTGTDGPVTKRPALDGSGVLHISENLDLSIACNHQSESAEESAVSTLNLIEKSEAVEVIHSSSFLLKFEVSGCLRPSVDGVLNNNNRAKRVPDNPTSSNRPIPIEVVTLSDSDDDIA